MWKKMKVLVDTPIWSLAFRKKNDNVNNKTIDGIPFSAFTGHHHTELVLTVNRADRQ
jgi:hypothetical protein